MIKQLSNSKTGGVFLIVLAIMLNACAPEVAALSGPQPCVLATPGINEYRAKVNPQVKSLYSQWTQNQGSADPSALQNVKNQAFTLLVDQVKHWTSAVDIPNDNTNVIRITLTYISPELAQIIILNHQLYKNFLSENNFEKTLTNKMNEIAGEEELIFLMTITYSQYNNQIDSEINKVTVSIPMDRLMLTNSENLQVVAHYVDPPLRQEIVVSRSPSTGYVTFPIGVGTLENCLQVINRRQNTVINVSTKGIKINGVDYAPQLSWTVKYHPLIEVDDGIISPRVNYTAPPEIPITHDPPIPARTMLADQVDALYWEQMALHVWGYV